MVEYSENAIPVLVVTGPTATGKTQVAIELAKKVDGEIVCADSMQIYKDLDIGTAKSTPAEMNAVPHHLFGFLPPEERYSVARYVEDAGNAVRDIHSRGKMPILCGGTGQYITAFTEGTVFMPVETDPQLRAKIYTELDQHGPQLLIDEIATSDAEYAASLHPNNHKRIVRAVELLRTTGYTIPQQNELSVPKERGYMSYIAVLHDAARQKMYDRINMRVDRMMKEGLLEEAFYVYQNKDRFVTAAQAIGYKELFPYFEKTATIQDSTDKLKQATRNYAKRQMTWFRGIDAAVWYDIGKLQAGKIAELIEKDSKKAFNY